MKKLIVLLALATVVLVSGCTSSAPQENNLNTTSDLSDNGTDSPRDTTLKTGDSADNGSSSDSRFGVSDVDVTSLEVVEDKVTLQDNVTINFSVRNNGTQNGTLDKALRVKYKPHGSWQDFYSILRYAETTIEGGETREFSLDQKIVHVDDLKFKYDGHSDTVNVTLPKLDVGETYTSLELVNLTVEKAELKDGYQRDGRKSGGRTLFVKFTAENTWDRKTIDSPNLMMLYNDETGQEELTPSEDVSVADNYDEFEVSKLEPNQKRTGYLSFEMPEGVDREDVKLRYETEDLQPGTTQRAFWSVK